MERLPQFKIGSRGELLEWNEELEEAEGALLSTLRKCEKIQEGGKLPPSQSTLLNRRVRALRLALGLIDERKAGLDG